jgi:heme exporter protein D
MKEVSELIKWFLEKDIRTKNAISMLVAIGSAFVFFMASHDRLWFQPIKTYGAVAVGCSVISVAIAAFICTSLVYACVVASREKLLEESRQSAAREAQLRSIRDTLETLTDWQRMFLLRFIIEQRSQIPEFDVGQFRAVWDFEMAVLVEKGVVKDYRHAGVYEIAPVYREYLAHNWDPESGTLR